MKFRNISTLSLIFIIVFTSYISLTISIPLKNGKFWHITDTHYDFMYIEGGDEDKQCREVTYKSKYEKGGASSIGNYKCDTSFELLQSSFEYMVKHEEKPDFIIWTGDDPPHFSNSQLNETLVLQSITNMTNLIKGYFPDIPIFPSIGNHDSYPQHQIGVGPNWLFENVAQLWSPFLSNDSIETFKLGGYYTELVNEGFRIISLNTVFYYNENRQCLNLTDPAGQLLWLNETLANASLAGERVWIIGHVPPGYNEKYDVFNFHKQFNDEYLFSFSQYSDIIEFHIYGHEHTDTFRLFYDDPNDHINDIEPTGIMFLSPSLTPWMNQFLPALPNNPGLRLYEYNITSFALLDYYQFWTNLTDNIISGNIDWQLEYRATEFFNTFNLSPVSMYEAYLLIQSVTSQLLKFHFYNSVSYPTKGCDEICKKIQLCSIRHPFTKGFKECLVEI
ncbi:hypothetical protein ACTFIR_000680 [Dictyostelium discoideum]